MKLKETLLISTLLAMAIIITACSPLPPGTSSEKPKTATISVEQFTPGADLRAKTFSSVAELKTFLQEHQQANNYYYGGGINMVRSIGAPMETTAMDTTAASENIVKQATGGSADFSTTNNQVQGVDEGDLIKTDGEYIYTISGNTLFIVKAYPGKDAKLVKKMTFDKGDPQGLFINGDNLIVYGRLTNHDLLNKLNVASFTSMTYLEVYDISDKNNPDLIKDFLFEGSYFASRMINNDVYLITQDYPRYPGRPLPLYVEDGITKSVPINTIKYFPIPYNSVSFVTINAIDVKSLKHNSATLTVEGSRQLYMSRNNLYFASTRYINEWQITQDITIKLVTPMLSATDQALIKKINAVDNEILSPYEKKQKVMNIISRYTELLSKDEQDALQDKIEKDVVKELKKYDYFEYTIINKVGVDGLHISPEASGEVPGHLYNQFSMDEYDGVLRVATTTNPHWSSIKDNVRTSENFVHALDENLHVIGALKNITPGERIYATRFVKDRLYLVTFRQVDPFFVIDLSNPKNIRSLGELKLPGFSRYLHPYDEDHLIGLGRDATETGRTKGLKISIFDVTDVNNPKETAHWVSKEKYASSTAEYEHKAFLFSKEKHLLVIPAYHYDYRNGDYTGYNGALVFNIDQDDIKLRGLIDHSKAARNHYGAAVERSLYIDDLLYTKSYSLLRINDLEDLKSVKNITLEQEGSGDLPVY